MTQQIRSDQATALGPAAPCQPAKKPPTNASGSGDGPKPKSVLILDPEKDGWIGIELLDTKKRPVAHAEFIVTPPNHDPVKGNLDAFGKARIEGVDPGSCIIEFPKLHSQDFL